MTRWLHQPRKAAAWSTASIATLSGNYYRASRNTYAACQPSTHPVTHSKTNLFRTLGWMRKIPPLTSNALQQVQVLLRLYVLINTEALSPPKMKWERHKEVCYRCLELNIKSHTNTSTWKPFPALVKAPGYQHHSLSHRGGGYGHTRSEDTWEAFLTLTDLQPLNDRNEGN